MTIKTESEILFESFCNQSGITCTPILTKSDEQLKTPDYEIDIGTQKIIVEIKQINPNEEDITQQKIFDAGGIASSGGMPGSRIRSKINDGAEQLRIYAKDKYPTILIVYNNVFMTDYTHPYHFLVAMYGLEAYILGVPKDANEAPYLIDKKFGKKQTTTKQHNTVISAVANLEVDENNNPLICVYHNIYAKIPLEYNILRPFKIRQFTLEDKMSKQFQDWLEI